MNKLNQLLIIAAASVGASFLLLTGVLMPAFAATSPTSNITDHNYCHSRPSRGQ
ncbi:hypothetical protein [Lactobacillus helveticus]|uniref:hypothetical protein n=1 Tax=Lactobacillus helveticus TaxID=1587 RepID=UPI001BCA90C1|nr:hypothetical protein [Lactobacillus helveticus]